MEQKYKNWIEYYKKREGSVQYKCQGASEEMAKAFPELRQVRGFCYVNHWPEQHWWCETEDGEVIDPTASQFDKISRYEEYNVDVHGPEPIGKCLDCGDYVYEDDHYHGFCDEYCEQSFRASLEVGFRY